MIDLSRNHGLCLYLKKTVSKLQCKPGYIADGATFETMAVCHSISKCWYLPNKISLF